MKQYTITLVMAMLAFSLCAQQPPLNLTATPGNGYVNLNWQPPMVNGMYELVYHDGIPFNGYIQHYDQGYGVIFDLSEYPSCTLSELDFRHSSYGINGPHQYNIHIIDWVNQQSLAVVENLTTTDDDAWEEGLELGDVTASGLVGVFIEPLSNDSEDAYPVVDCDAQLDYTSFVIDVDNLQILTPGGADGDFLIDLWITPQVGAVVQAPQAPMLSPLAHRATGVSTQQLRQGRPHPLPPSRDLLGYNVYRDDDLLTLEPQSYHLLSYTDDDVTNGQTYTYWVTALYDEGESGPSNEVQATPTGPADIIFYESFESGIIPGGWVCHDEDGDDFQWQIAPIAVEAYEGQKCIWSQSFDNGVMQPLTPDNWIVTPPIEITEPCYLKFWVRTQDFVYPTEHFEVWVSTDSSDVEDFAVMLYEETTVAEDWHRVSLELSDYVGQICYFAWRHCDSNNNYAVVIDEIFITTNLPTNDDMAPALQNELRAWPNPFNPTTTLAFELERPERVRLAVYDVRGRRVTTLIDGPMAAGAHSLCWNGVNDNGESIASGIYFCRLEAGEHKSVRKLVLLK
ncbi:MAG: choice-of-anchor J domain-containing protein [Candidatus Cloacimonetes bacterium]|nr:choice-of-anchor J domain-containing protein [Candidatus Cloacimonadota bacterium]